MTRHVASKGTRERGYPAARLIQMKRVFYNSTGGSNNFHDQKHVAT